MGCCGLCRPKVKPTIKTNKNITTKKVNRIDMWIDTIESLYEPIILPSKPPDEPKIITNKEEITEVQSNDPMSDTNISNDEYDNGKTYQKLTNKKQNLQYLSSNLSINEEIQPSISENDSANIP